MTRLLFRSTLAALCLTAVTAGSARSDSWFSGWGRKKAAVASENAAFVSDENEVEAPDAMDDDDTGHAQRWRIRGDRIAEDFNDSRLHAIDSVNMKHAEHQARRAARRENREQRRMARRDGRGGYGGYGGYGDGVYPACYPQLNSSLYPCPRPDIPQEVGSTVITNQALYPHEMLYAHQYRAIYPPFYYENKCGITCLPFFPRPCIAGTVVTVKYKTCLPCGFHPPIANVCGLNYPWSAAGIPSFHSLEKGPR
jgi:hypothetical protein